MVTHVEIECARCAPAPQLDIVVLVCAIGHAVLRQIRQVQAQRLQARLHGVQFSGGGAHLLADLGHFGLQRFDVLAAGLGLANSLGLGVARRLQFLGAHLQALAVRLDGGQGVQVQGVATARQGGGHGRRIIAEAFGVQHWAESMTSGRGL